MCFFSTWSTQPICNSKHDQTTASSETNFLENWPAWDLWTMEASTGWQYWEKFTTKDSLNFYGQPDLLMSGFLCFDFRTSFIGRTNQMILKIKIYVAIARATTWNARKKQGRNPCLNFYTLTLVWIVFAWTDAFRLELEIKTSQRLHSQCKNPLSWFQTLVPRPVGRNEDCSTMLTWHTEKKAGYLFITLIQMLYCIVLIKSLWSLSLAFLAGKAGLE